MVVITSTNGTAAIAPFHISGAILTTAPIKRPPALPPSAKRCSLSVMPSLIKYLPATIKSVKVFFLFNIFPSS